MKALIFNHHPDYAWHIWKNLMSLKIECFFATEKSTLAAGANYSSTIGPENKFQLISPLYKPEELFPDMTNLQFTDELQGFDYYFTCDPYIAQKLNVKGLIWSATIQPYLQQIYNPEKFVKITSAQNAEKYGAKYLQYFVPQNGILKEKKYITQLISDFRNIPTTEKLLSLKKTYNVIVAGSSDAPDGIVNDWETLSQTALLCHEKNWGTNCNSVCKALDTGVPVYISKANKEILGFSDLPDFMFVYSDFYSVEQAYEIALKKDNKTIQTAYRKLRNCELSRIYMYNILNNF
jgi:hypothetical protein